MRMPDFKKILFIGPRSRGGIDAVLTVYQQMMPGARFITTYRGGSKCRKLWDFLRSFLTTLWTLMTVKDIEVIHIHSASKNSFWRKLKFVRLGKLFSKKVVMHIHGGSFDEFMTANLDTVKKGLMTCDGIICLSEQWYEFFKKHGIVNLVTLPNPVDYPKSVHRPQTDKIHLLFLGVLSTQKGIYDLIEAFHAIPDEDREHLILHIGGDGEERPELERRLKDLNLVDQVIIEGWVDGARKLDLLKISSGFILPSYIEGLPVSILEAMAWGMPIISTPVGGIPSVVRPNGNGILVQPGDIQELTNAIKQIATNSKLRERMGNESRIIAAQYSSTAIIDKLLNFYTTNGIKL